MSLLLAAGVQIGLSARWGRRHWTEPTLRCWPESADRTGRVLMRFGRSSGRSCCTACLVAFQAHRADPLAGRLALLRAVSLVVVRVSIAARRTFEHSLLPKLRRSFLWRSAEAQLLRCKILSSEGLATRVKGWQRGRQVVIAGGRQFVICLNPARQSRWLRTDEAAAALARSAENEFVGRSRGAIIEGLRFPSPPSRTSRVVRSRCQH